MANLFEIDQAILACVDPETGEIISPELLDGLFMERNAKIENVALWAKNLRSDAAAYEAEEKAFAERKKKALAKVESLEKWLASVCGGEKFSTGKCEVSFRKSDSVEVLDKNMIPADYLRTKTTVTTEPDKNAIKKAIKGGQTIAGCALVEKLNTKIV